MIPVDKSAASETCRRFAEICRKLNEYTAQSGQILCGEHLRAAENILEKQDATKEEVDQACANLRNAVFGLRLIPSKEKLEELIQSAEQIDVKLYTEESAENFMSALAKAKEVFADEDATKAEVEDARTGTCKKQSTN